MDGTAHSTTTQSKHAAPLQCWYYDHPPENLSLQAALQGVFDSTVSPSDYKVGNTYYYVCLPENPDITTPLIQGSFTYGVHSPGTQAWVESQLATLPLTVPDVQTSPPRDAPNGQIVGFPTWLWMNPGTAPTDWRTITPAPAQVQDLTATITANPLSATYNFGDGTTLTCTGPGQPWNPTGPPNQTSPCTHTYQNDSHNQPDNQYTITTTMTWTITWHSNDGDGGTLPNLSRTTTFTLPVHSYQAIITG